MFLELFEMFLGHEAVHLCWSHANPETLTLLKNLNAFLFIFSAHKRQQQMSTGKQYLTSHRLIGFRQRPKKAQQRLLVPHRVDIWYLDDRCHSIWCHLCSRCHSYCHSNCVPCYVLSQAEKASLGAGSDYARREASSARNRCVGCLRTNSTIHGLN